MDRVFLDANVLFSASYRQNSGLLRLWQLKDIELVTSSYALDEARRNLIEEPQLSRLNQLALTVVAPVWTQDSLPDGIAIAKKDLPILLDAIHSQSSYLLTGDKQHFGTLYRQVLSGGRILPPADFIASRTTGGGLEYDNPAE